MKPEKHYYEGRNAGLQYYEIPNDRKPLVLLHAQGVDSGFGLLRKSEGQNQCCSTPRGWTAAASSA